MKSFTSRVCIAFALSMSGGLGCGAPGFEDETVSEVHEALSTWNDLVTMPSSGNFTLTANINAAGQTWTPKDFSGTFDGGNHTISNLTLNSKMGFFGFLTNATIKNLKFTNLRITGSGTEYVGGIAGHATDSTIENCVVEGNINVSTFSAGGLVGEMLGGRIFRSYAKGTITGTMQYTGGLAGAMIQSSVGRAVLNESYAQVTVNPSTSNTSMQVVAGGLVGYAYASEIYDAYAVGNVTGRGFVGGIVGWLDCIPDWSFFMMFKTIYRGDVVDRNRSNGWAGGVGEFRECTARFEQNFYDRSLDQSGAHGSHHSIQGYTTQELRSPTSVIGGVFCAPDLGVPGRCGDNTWQSTTWTAGTNQQHHVLRNMPGPNSQPR